MIRANVLCCSGGYLNNYYEFVGVQGCEDVLSLYTLIWILTGLNLVAFFMGILTTAVLGSIMDQVRNTLVYGVPHLKPKQMHARTLE